LPTSPLDEIHTLNDYLAVQRYPFQAFSWVAAAVGFVALLLTVTGIYGVLSYLVTQRTKEIGIRIALGAGLEDVIGMVLRQSLLFALLGTTIGTALALVVSRLFATVLIIVDTFDKLAYAGGAAVVIAAALAAAYAPARRAAAVDPLTTLKGV
jgi:ABC-type antimicrobial peptide transport system permease subunit